MLQLLTPKCLRTYLLSFLRSRHRMLQLCERFLPRTWAPGIGLALALLVWGLQVGADGRLDMCVDMRVNKREAFLHAKL